MAAGGAESGPIAELVGDVGGPLGSDGRSGAGHRAPSGLAVLEALFLRLAHRGLHWLPGAEGRAAELLLRPVARLEEDTLARHALAWKEWE